MASKKFSQFDTANNTSETELSVGVKGGDNFKRRNFLTATTNPTVNDDNSDGYTVGSFWFNASTGTMYICKDSTVGAAVWVTQGGDLQTAYDNGRVVNGQTVTFDANGQIGLGNGALQDSTATFVVALGEAAAKDSSGAYINAIGANAGRGNTASDSNFFGRDAGWDGGTETGNTTAFGVTCFSLASIPQYNNHAAAAAALTVANGCVANTVYIYLNTSNDTVGFIIPT